MRLALVLISSLAASALLLSACCDRPGSTGREPSATRQETDDGRQVETGAPVDAGSVLQQDFRFSFGIYHLPKASKDGAAEFRSRLAGHPIKLRQAPPTGVWDSPFAYVDKPPLDKYAPPDMSSLQYFARGLSEQQKEELQRSQEVTAMHFGGPPGGSLGTYKVALGIAATVGADTGGLLWDEDTREVFTREAWARRMDGFDGDLPSVRDHVAIHGYKHGGLIRIVTLGMRKFALPDVAMNDVPANVSQSASSLVQVVCQSLLENPTLAEDARKTTTVSLAMAKPQPGDADNGLIDIVFPGPAIGLQERQSALLSELFGSTDRLLAAKSDDTELTAASLRAKAEVMKLKPRFKTGAPELEHLMVKAPFDTDDGNREYMWIEVTRWEGDTVSGVLESDPFGIKALKSGARVSVKESLIFDYIHVLPDGGRQGNETGKILERKQPML